MAFIENPAMTTPEVVQNAISQVRGMIESGYVSGNDMSAYFKAVTSLATDQLKSMGVNKMAYIEHMMSPNQICL